MSKGSETVAAGAVVAVVAIAAVVNPAGAVKIDYEAVKWIESRGNPEAVGSAGEVGLFQISSVVLKAYNSFHFRDFSRSELVRPAINQKIAVWYLSERIPELLRHYGKRVTVKNILWSYNAGIRHVVEGKMPEVTARYIKTYKKIT